MRKEARKGTVYLVGAGPGDPDLITRRGLELLRQADIVIYDRLVHSDLMSEVRPGALKEFVGKGPGLHYRPQEEINLLLVRHALNGSVVVRLKGGDPFVFGRGGEEAEVLADAGIPFEVVPGVTSAVAVPAYAGIPLTHRGVASAFTVVTGHSCREGADPDWAALARAGTLVILMGLRRLPEIASILIRHGQTPETPAAIVSSGTTREQIVVEGTLRTIGELSRELDPPATIVIGDVVRLRESLQWYAGAVGHSSPAGRTHVDRPPLGLAESPYESLARTVVIEHEPH